MPSSRFTAVVVNRLTEFNAALEKTILRPKLRIVEILFKVKMEDTKIKRFFSLFFYTLADKQTNCRLLLR